MKASEVAAALRELADALDTIQADIVKPCIVFSHFGLYDNPSFFALVKAFDGATRLIDGRYLRIRLTQSKALGAYASLDVPTAFQQPLIQRPDLPESIMRIPEGK